MIYFCENKTINFEPSSFRLAFHLPVHQNIKDLKLKA